MTSTIPRGIHQLDEPCWTIVTHDGRPAGFEESEPHYLTEDEARAEAPGFQREDDPPVKVVQVEGHRCWAAYLNCGTQYVYEGGEDAIHFADEQGVRDAIDNDRLPIVDEAAGLFACDDHTCQLCSAYQLTARTGEVADSVTDLAALVMKFGLTPRTTFHPDGKTFESDTTHTVMLGMVACAIADRFFPHLDQGKIAMAALVHDLPEVHAGDTCTLRALDDDAKAAKDAAEKRAALRIHIEFHPVLPWVSRTLGKYMHLVDPEDRFVKAVDKMLPKLTHLLNNARSIGVAEMSRADLAARLELQRTEMAVYASEFPPLFTLHKTLGDRVLALLPEGGAQ